MDLAAPGNDVHDLKGVQVRIELHSWRDEAGLILDEVEGIYHVVRRNLTVDAYAEEADDCALERVVHRERGALPLFHVEGDLLEPTHVEESLVLDGREAWVVEEVAEHEGPRLLLLETAGELCDLVLAQVAESVLLLSGC